MAEYANSIPAPAVTRLLVLTDREVGEGLVQTVNARDLHAFLEIGKDFSTWLKDRIAAYDFKENNDFVCSPILGSEGRGGHNRVDYHITLDMAKELSMVERNAKGKEARQYFIACERRAKEAAADFEAKLNDPAFLRGKLSDYAGKVLALEGKVEEMRPRVEALERIANSDGDFCITDAAKTLQVRPKTLFSFLRSNGWIYSRGGGAEVAYQDKLAQGMLSHKTTTVTRTDGTEKTVTQIRVTTKGLTRLARECPPVARLV